MAARLIHNFVSDAISLLYAALYACVTKTFLMLGFCILGTLNALGRASLLLPDGPIRTISLEFFLWSHTIPCWKDTLNNTEDGVDSSWPSLIIYCAKKHSPRSRACMIFKKRLTIMRKMMGQGKCGRTEARTGRSEKGRWECRPLSCFTSSLENFGFVNIPWRLRGE